MHLVKAYRFDRGCAVVIKVRPCDYFYRHAHTFCVEQVDAWQCQGLTCCMLHCWRGIPVSILGHDWDVSHSPFGIKPNRQEGNVKLFGHCLDLQCEEVHVRT